MFLISALFHGFLRSTRVLVAPQRATTILSGCCSNRSLLTAHESFPILDGPTVGKLDVRRI